MMLQVGVDNPKLCLAVKLSGGRGSTLPLCPFFQMAQICIQLKKNVHFCSRASIWISWDCMVSWSILVLLSPVSCLQVFGETDELIDGSAPTCQLSPSIWWDWWADWLMALLLPVSCLQVFGETDQLTGPTGWQASHLQQKELVHSPLHSGWARRSRLHNTDNTRFKVTVAWSQCNILYSIPCRHR